jgi:hypothetical protein
VLIFGYLRYSVPIKLVTLGRRDLELSLWVPYDGSDSVPCLSGLGWFTTDIHGSQGANEYAVVKRRNLPYVLVVQGAKVGMLRGIIRSRGPSSWSRLER